MSLTLSVGSFGNDVRRLQDYLNAELAASLLSDGSFGGSTRQEVERFRKRYGLPSSPSFDAGCYAVSAQRGLQPLAFSTEPKKQDLSTWPPRPRKLTSPSGAHMQARCGTILFEWQPVPGNAEHIRVTNSFVEENIVTVEVPQLRDCIVPVGKNSFMKEDGRIRFHKNHAGRLVQLFSDWDAAGLMNRILTFDGSFVSRLKRGSTKGVVANLSNHAWGTAFDINAYWNPLGTVPAAMGDRGCARELVEIANQNGFFWGGHFGEKRSDGMHFEVAAETM